MTRVTPLALAVALGACLLAAPAAASPQSRATPHVQATTTTATTADWPTYHGNRARSGVAAGMPRASGAPRLVANLRLDGAVYASPIVVGGMTIVATENDSVYGLDAAYHVIWRTRIGAPATDSDLPCGNITPLGITGTPFYLANTGMVYVAGESGSPVRHQLVAMSPATGAVAWRRSLDLPGVQTNAMQQRGALTVTAGRVWVPFGGLAGDCGGYHGRVVGMPLSGVGDPVAYTVPTERRGGIWAPGGPTVDSAGRLYVATANSIVADDAPYDGSDSVTVLDDHAQRADFFTPAGWRSDDARDVGLGSVSPAFVGPWVLAFGKSPIGYVLRHDALGGIGGEVSSFPACATAGGTSVAGSAVYLPCRDGGMEAVRVAPDGTARVVWTSNAGNGSPVIGGGRVWTVAAGPGLLHGLDPATGRTLEHVSVGATSHFATPAINGPDVLVPTLTGLAVVRTS